jgi:thiamine-monophosphate kinase
VFAATGGDEYELLFAASVSARASIDAMGRSLSLPLTRVGSIAAAATSACEIRWLDRRGQPIPQELAAECGQGGFDHFKS